MKHIQNHDNGMLCKLQSRARNIQKWLTFIKYSFENSLVYIDNEYLVCKI